MASYTGTLTNAGDASDQIFIRPGEAFDYSLTESAPGTWRVYLERAITPGFAYERLTSFIDDVASTTYYNTTGHGQYYRLRLDSVAVVTVDFTLADSASEVVQSFTNPVTGVDEIQLTDQGVTIPRDLAVGGNVTVTGTLSSSGGSQSPTTLILPNATVPAQTADASIVWDSDTDLLTVGTGAGRKTFLDTNSTQTGITGKTFTSPTLTTPVLNGAITGSGTAASKRWLCTGRPKVGTTAGWVVGAANNRGGCATLPAAQTTSTLVLDLSGLRLGDIITAFWLVGQVEAAGNHVVIDADLRKLSTAADDLTDASIGAITQIDVVADTALSSSNANKTLVSPETIGVDETFYVLITGTTGAATDIDLQGVMLVITETLFASGE